MNLLKKTVLITATSLLVNSAFALTSTESQALTQKILSSKVIDMPLVAAKLVVAADKADRIETAKAAVVAVAKNHPTALSTVVGAILRKAPEATEAVVAAATFATEGQDAVILATADRLVPNQQSEVRGEVALAKARRATKSSVTAKAGTITIPGNVAVTTTPVTDSKGNAVAPPVKISAYAGADANRP